MAYPYPDLIRMNKAKDLRHKGLSIREVARVMKAHPKSVQRWLSYSVDELSTHRFVPA